MTDEQRKRLRDIKTFSQLIAFLRDELEWPIERGEDEDDLTFDWSDDLGLEDSAHVGIKEIKQLRPLEGGQPWGIFFINFEKKRLPIVILRRILNALVLKKRASANKAQRASWQQHDLLFISAYGEDEERQLTFAHFSEPSGELTNDKPTLRVLGWDDEDTNLKLDYVADKLREKLTWPTNTSDVQAWRTRWSDAFEFRPRQVVNTSEELALRLAELAKRIRGRALRVLEHENEMGALRKLMKGFKAALMHDLDNDKFADMYAQTITYGLFSAAVSRTVPGAGTSVVQENVADMVPITNPFLKEMLGSFLKAGGRKGKLDFDELGIQEVVNLLNDKNTRLDAVLRDFGNKTRQEDPVIHFYELFLAAYDKKLKAQRGVFYTPQPVVSYIVRGVHELLQTEFGLEDGLASTITWGEIVRSHLELEIPEGTSPDQAFVQILDPATGTATFLVTVIDVVHRHLKSKWENGGLKAMPRLPPSNWGQRSENFQTWWNQYVALSLLPRLHGYELMMAPYAIAHMKIGLKLHETGYRFGTTERARIYLTNSLEPPTDNKKQEEFAELAPALAHEALAVNEIKRHKRFTVVIGNPPYAGHSLNNQITWIVDKVHDYKRGIPELNKPAQAKWLQDDYVKFVRFAEVCIDQAGVGTVGYITNHSYLDNPTFRGMRNHLLGTFDSIRILDLHGNQKKKETAKDGSLDENVFDILQGVCVALATRHSQVDSIVMFSELLGLRKLKYSSLGNSDIANGAWQPLTPRPQYFLLRPENSSLAEEYDQFITLPAAMNANGDPAPGIVTTHDEFAISWSRAEAISKVSKLLQTQDEIQARQLFRLCGTTQWSYDHAKAELPNQKWLEEVGQILYRPFDVRWTVYNSHVAVHRRLRASRHFLGTTNNIGLCVGKAGQVVGSGEWNLVSCTRFAVDFNYFYRGGACNFPLYLQPENQLVLEGPQRVNFSESFLKALSDRIGTEQLIEGEPYAESILHYIYAVLHSPCYRNRYAEFLKMDFPRLPLAGEPILFRELARLGGEIVSLHLLKSPMLDKSNSASIGGSNPKVEKISWSNNTVWIDKAQATGFSGVPENVWNFAIGGYQVCEKWLKDRKGRTLSNEDVTHYQKIVVALNETIRLMKEIDKVIDKHGGWPDAFSPTEKVGGSA